MKKIVVCAIAVILTLALASCQIIDTIKNLGNGGDTAAATEKPSDPAATTAEGKATETDKGTDPATQSETETDTEPQQSETEPYIDPAPQLVEETLLDAGSFALLDDLLYIGSALRSVGADFDDASDMTQEQAFRAIIGEIEYVNQMYEDVPDGDGSLQKTVTVYADEKVDERTEIRFGRKYDLKTISYEYTDEFGDEHSGKYGEGEGVVVKWVGSAHGGTFSHQECEQIIEQKFSDGGVLYKATVAFYTESEAPQAGYEDLYKFIEDGGYDTWVFLHDKYEVMFRDNGGVVSVISYHPISVG
ncbi:MAG: hypothetical protein IKX86_05805 [Clostridia bacterium]|nr:hypothetical protein [Clostridia bacterium]